MKHWNSEAQYVHLRCEREARRSPRKQINAPRSNINSIIETKRAEWRCGCGCRWRWWQWCGVSRGGGRGARGWGLMFLPSGVGCGEWTRGEELCCRDIVLRGTSELQGGGFTPSHKIPSHRLPVDCVLCVRTRSGRATFLHTYTYNI